MRQKYIFKKILIIIFSVIILDIHNPIYIYANEYTENSIPKPHIYYSFYENMIYEGDGEHYIISDLSGNGYNSTAIKDNIEIVNNAVSGSFIIPNEAFRETTSFTMNFWLSATYSGLSRTEIINFDNNIILYSAWGSGTPRLCQYCENGIAVYAPKYSATSVDIEKLNMYTIVKNNDIIQMYINGRAIDATLGTWINQKSSVNWCDVATNGADLIVSGNLLDEFRFYNDVLDEKTIKSLYDKDMISLGLTTEPDVTDEPTAEPDNTEIPLPTPETTIQPTDIPKYSYEINGMSAVSVSGKGLDGILQNSSFIVDISVTKTLERDAKDFVFVAVYDTDGALLSLDYVKADFPLNAECSFGFNVPGQEKQVGSIKAYVWNSFTSPVPLAESKTIIFNCSY